MKRFIGIAFTEGALISNGRNSFWNRIPVEENQARASNSGNVGVWKGPASSKPDGRHSDIGINDEKASTNKIEANPLPCQCGGLGTVHLDCKPWQGSVRMDEADRAGQIRRRWLTTSSPSSTAVLRTRARRWNWALPSCGGNLCLRVSDRRVREDPSCDEYPSLPRRENSHRRIGLLIERQRRKTSGALVECYEQAHPRTLAPFKR